MAAPSSRTLLIACPHCATRYQVAAEMLGPRARRVTCANCGRTWRAEPMAPEPPAEPEPLFTDAEEEALDAALAAAEKASRPVSRPTNLDMLLADAETPAEIRRSIEEIRAALAPRPEPRPVAEKAPEADPPEAQLMAQKRMAKAFERRLKLLTRSLPTSRIRRVLRIAGLTLLAGLLVVGIGFRVEVVRAIPDLAGLYQAIGLGVNVVGLEFTGVTTLLSRRDGTDVLSVRATIRSVEQHTVPVPPVVVTVTDARGAPIYQWSVTPAAAELEPHETLEFSTQLSSPPPGARNVRLSFSTQTGRPVPAAGPAPTGK
jgi:predicted Zn finger-like uncharacterized protein